MVFDSSPELEIPICKLADGYVYVLEIERDDGELYYYVGSTTKVPESRIREHVSGHTCRSMPVMRNNEEVLGDTSEQDFVVTGVERLIPVDFDSKDKLLNVERETAYQVAIDHQTTNVSGVQP